MKGSTMAISNHDRVSASLVELAQMALNFSRIQRTGVCHADGTPETDADHTVMLTWLAPTLAQMVDEELNPGLVCVLAAVHDAVEVYAGDTSTIKLTEEEFSEKYDREAIAARKLVRQFMEGMPFFATSVSAYEEQHLAEARFVRAVDKLMPKLVHVIDGCVGVRRAGTTREDFREMAKKQRAQMAEYAAEWPDLFILHITLCEKVLLMPQWDDPLPPAQQTSHRLHYHPDGTWMVEHHLCLHDPNSCPFTLATKIREARGELGRGVDDFSIGVWRMELDEWGELHLAVAS